VTGPVLAVFAHADDADIACGASLAKWARAGRHVAILVITDGSRGSWDRDDDRASLVAARRSEQREAAAILGVDDIRFLDVEDGTLENTPEVRARVARVIREVRPATVVCPDPTTWFFSNRYLNHRDHRMAGEVALDALFPGAGNPHYFADQLADGLDPWDVPEAMLVWTTEPNHFEDVSGLLDVKLQALEKHASQMVGPQLDFFKGWIPLEAEEHGRRIGAEHAEAFRQLQLRDATE
jgi:LmbE family N-acetylglucosaminyl deacetylase